jgi:hypothetical protein
MKRTGKFTSIALAILLGTIVCAQAEPKSLVGVATPIINTTIQYGFNDSYRGIINYTARPDQIVHGPTFNTEGEIIKPGTLLIQMDTAYRQAVINNLKAKVKQDEDSLKIAVIQYKRFKKLSKEQAVSIESFEDWQNQYLVLVNTLVEDKAKLMEQEKVYKMTTLRAHYEAIVDTVFFPYGLPAGELAVMKLSQLNPMGIEVKMNRDTARSITNETPVAVYPVNSDKPVGIANDYMSLTKKGIMFRVLNYQLPPAASEKDGKLLSIVRCEPVCQLFGTYPASKQTGVPIAALYNDNTGTYVWKAVGVQSLEPGKGHASVFPVKKVYVKLEDVVNKIAGFAEYQKLLPNKNLNRGDVVIIAPPKGLQENEEVCIAREKYLFMPGDKVKVVIGQKSIL